MRGFLRFWLQENEVVLSANVFFGGFYGVMKSSLVKLNRSSSIKWWIAIPGTAATALLHFWKQWETVTSGLGGRAAAQLTLVVACFSIFLWRKWALDIYTWDQSNTHWEGKRTSSMNLNYQSKFLFCSVRFMLLLLFKRISVQKKSLKERQKVKFNL